MTCNDATLSLGVYLVGALEPAERVEVETHLATCAECRHELDQLAALPSLLDRLRLEDIEPMHAAEFPAPEPAIRPTEELFDRVAARARDEDELAQVRRSRGTRFRLLASAAAAVVVLGGVGIGVAELSGGGGSGRGVTVSSHGVRMHVTLASEATGTALHVSVSGLPDDEHCTLIAVAKDGSRDVAGQWDATYSGLAQETGSTAIPMGNLAQLILLGTHGQTLVTAPV
jgi:anti-sigma factor ChrR (cupin superfamily)